MTTNPSIKIVLYKTGWCSQSLLVEEYLTSNDIEVEMFDIDHDLSAREDLIKLNGGYASVPTLLFADGTKLTEPSLAEVQRKVRRESSPGILDRIRGLFSR